MAGKKPRTSMWIEPAPKTFSDKRLDPTPTPGDPAEKMVKPTAKPGGSISPIQRSINIPRTNPMRSA